MRSGVYSIEVTVQQILPRAAGQVLGREQPQEPSAFGHAGEQGPMVPRQPAIAHRLSPLPSLPLPETGAQPMATCKTG